MSIEKTVIATAKHLTFDELCQAVEQHLETGPPHSHRPAITELIRRARVMDQHLSPKPEPEDESMPEPVEVWFWRPTAHEAMWREPMWRSRNNDPATDTEFRDVDIRSVGPYQIIPGMMSLDELAAYKISLSTSNRIWRVWQDGVRSHTIYGTALEAQWAATQLAKKGGG